MHHNYECTAVTCLLIFLILLRSLRSIEHYLHVSLVLFKQRYRFIKVLKNNEGIIIKLLYITS